MMKTTNVEIAQKVTKIVLVTLIVRKYGDNDTIQFQKLQAQRTYVMMLCI